MKRLAPRAYSASARLRREQFERNCRIHHAEKGAAWREVSLTPLYPTDARRFSTPTGKHPGAGLSEIRKRLSQPWERGVRERATDISEAESLDFGLGDVAAAFRRWRWVVRWYRYDDDGVRGLNRRLGSSSLSQKGGHDD